LGLYQIRRAPVNRDFKKLSFLFNRPPFRRPARRLSGGSKEPQTLADAPRAVNRVFNYFLTGFYNLFELSLLHDKS
jgi:hypothetical protein